MKLLLDVCVASHALVRVLEESGHEVKSAYEFGPLTADSDLLGMCLPDGRILITADKDFGKLVFVERLPHAGVIRFVKLDINQQCSLLPVILHRYESELTARAFITLSANRTRVRRHDPDDVEDAELTRDDESASLDD